MNKPHEEYTLSGLQIMQGTRFVAAGIAEIGRYESQQRELQELVDCINDQRAGRVCFWTFEYDGQIYDAEFSTRDDAYGEADESFAEQCNEDGERGTHTRDITLHRFSYDDETGERVIHRTVAETLEWTYERSDFEEHNTLYRGGAL